MKKTFSLTFLIFLFLLSPSIAYTHANTTNDIASNASQEQLDNVFRHNPRCRFKDIKGYENGYAYNNAKETGYNIIKYINNPEKFQRMDIWPTKGMMLYGPGPTLCWAEALCGEINDSLQKNSKGIDDFGFFIIKQNHTQQMGPDSLLALMKQWVPCVVVFEEAEWLYLQRHYYSEHFEKFFSELGKLLCERNPKKQMFIIVTAINPENISPKNKLVQWIYFDENPYFKYETKKP